MPRPLLFGLALATTAAPPRATTAGQGLLGRPTVKLFAAGEAGVRCYRVPALVEAAPGTLLAFAEARYGPRCMVLGFLDLEHPDPGLSAPACDGHSTAGFRAAQDHERGAALASAASAPHDGCAATKDLTLS